MLGTTFSRNLHAVAVALGLLISVVSCRVPITTENIDVPVVLTTTPQESYVTPVTVATAVMVITAIAGMAFAFTWCITDGFTNFRRKKTSGSPSKEIASPPDNKLAAEGINEPIDQIKEPKESNVNQSTNPEEVKKNESTNPEEVKKNESTNPEDLKKNESTNLEEEKKIHTGASGTILAVLSVFNNFSRSLHLTYLKSISNLKSSYHLFDKSFNLIMINSTISELKKFVESLNLKEDSAAIIYNLALYPEEDDKKEKVLSDFWRELHGDDQIDFNYEEDETVSKFTYFFNRFNHFKSIIHDEIDGVDKYVEVLKTEIKKVDEKLYELLNPGIESSQSPNNENDSRTLDSKGDDSSSFDFSKIPEYLLKDAYNYMLLHNAIKIISAKSTNGDVNQIINLITNSAGPSRLDDVLQYTKSLPSKNQIDIRNEISDRLFKAVGFLLVSDEDSNKDKISVLNQIKECFETFDLNKLMKLNIQMLSSSYFTFNPVSFISSMHNSNIINPFEANNSLELKRFKLSKEKVHQLYDSIITSNDTLFSDIGPLLFNNVAFAYKILFTDLNEYSEIFADYPDLLQNINK